jgi:hypothetical protein
VRRLAEGEAKEPALSGRLAIEPTTRARKSPPATPSRWRSVSQLARATGAEIRKRLLSELVEPTRFGVPLDPPVETSRLEFLEPGTELPELIGGNSATAFSMSSRVVMATKPPDCGSLVTASHRDLRRGAERRGADRGRRKRSAPAGPPLTLGCHSGGRPSRMFPSWANYDFGEVGNTREHPGNTRLRARSEGARS